MVGNFNSVRSQMVVCKALQKLRVKSQELKDKLDFRHGSTGQIISIGMTESIFTDGEKCMERIRTCNDLTHIYINGKCYQMPWYVEQGHPYTNLLQTTTKECTDGKEFITIAIKAREAINEL